MGLAIDGNEVHGIAKGGQAFVSLGNTNTDGSINIGGQDYLNKNKIKIKSTDSFDVSINEGSATIDVTDNLSNYGGCLAICAIYNNDASKTPLTSDAPNVPTTFIISQPIIIPTASTTGNVSFTDSSNWSGSLSKTTDNKFTFVSNYNDGTSSFSNIDATGEFYILSNN
jgi:hypothetical protein|nr:MAG TPA: hypothetical protein [Caudoviricetes sp.]